MSIVLRLQPAPAWLYLVPTAAALGHSGDKGGARPPFPSSLNLPRVGRPATHSLLRQLQPQQHSLGRGAPCVSPGQVGPIYSSICPYSFQLQEPYMPRQPTVWKNIQISPIPSPVLMVRALLVMSSLYEVLPFIAGYFKPLFLLSSFVAHPKQHQGDFRQPLLIDFFYLIM